MFKLYTHLVKVSALHFKNLRLSKNLRMSNCNENQVTEKGNVIRVFFKFLSRLKTHSTHRMHKKGTLQAVKLEICSTPYLQNS